MVQKCSSCGCEDAFACPGGCFWVKDDLCSKCAQAIFVCRKCGHKKYVPLDCVIAIDMSRGCHGRLMISLIN